jgi:hypothetical protein
MAACLQHRRVMLTPVNATPSRALIRTAVAVAIGFAIGIAAAIIGVSTARVPPSRHYTITTPTPASTATTPAPDPVGESRIIDVSSALVSASGALDTLVALIRLAPGERIAAVDGRADSSDGIGMLAAAWSQVSPGDFIDLAIRDGAGNPRRVVLLVHQ